MRKKACELWSDKTDDWRYRRLGYYSGNPIGGPFNRPFYPNQIEGLMKKVLQEFNEKKFEVDFWDVRYLHPDKRAGIKMKRNA